MSGDLLHFSSRGDNQELLSLRSRLVVPFEERDRGNFPAEFAQESFFEFSSAVHDELATRNITQKMKWSVDLDGLF